MLAYPAGLSPSGATGTARQTPFRAQVTSGVPVLALIAMAQLIVRNLPDELVRRLKERATRHGRSTEAEHRELLREALLAEKAPPLKELIAAIPNVGRDADFSRPRRRARRVRL